MSTVKHEQGMLAYTYSQGERDWVVMRLEGTNWNFVRIASGRSGAVTAVRLAS